MTAFVIIQALKPWITTELLLTGLAGGEISNDDKKKVEIYDCWTYFPPQVWRQSTEMFIPNAPPSQLWHFQI